MLNSGGLGKGELYVFYRDEGGVVAVMASDCGVDFLDGIAYFDESGSERQYKIPIERLVSIHA